MRGNQEILLHKGMENNPQQGIGYSLGKASTVIREARARLYDFVPGASQILAVEIASFTN